MLKKVGKLIFIRGDLNNYEEISAIFSDYPIEAVFHFAAFIEVGESVKDPEKGKVTMQRMEKFLENIESKTFESYEISSTASAVRQLT